MIYFREHHWLPVWSQTRFKAQIDPGEQHHDEVFWMLDFKCIAGGQPWRRVQSWDRPTLWLEISSFKPRLRDWTGLEHLDFWNLDTPDGSVDDRCLDGYLNTRYHPHGGTKKPVECHLNDCIWRVAGREAGWFTVELVAFADREKIREALDAREVSVTTEGHTEATEPDVDFWKQHADLYFVENIPFGTVTVRTPRNVRDPEAYALRRAQDLIGVNQPEHIEVTDFLKISERDKKECSDNISQDLFVELQFNGCYED